LHTKSKKAGSRPKHCNPALEDNVVRDRESVRVPLMLMDSLQSVAGVSAPIHDAFREPSRLPSWLRFRWCRQWSRPREGLGRTRAGFSEMRGVITRFRNAFQPVMPKPMLEAW